MLNLKLIGRSITNYLLYYCYKLILLDSRRNQSKLGYKKLVTHYIGYRNILNLVKSSQTRIFIILAIDVMKKHF